MIPREHYVVDSALINAGGGGGGGGGMSSARGGGNNNRGMTSARRRSLISDGSSTHTHDHESTMGGTTPGPPSAYYETSKRFFSVLFPAYKPGTRADVRMLWEWVADVTERAGGEEALEGDVETGFTVYSVALLELARQEAGDADTDYF